MLISCSGGRLNARKNRRISESEWYGPTSLPLCHTRPRAHIVSVFLAGGRHAFQHPHVWLSRCSWVFGVEVKSFIMSFFPPF
jgi:hypothetical protein